MHDEATSRWHDGTESLNGSAAVHGTLVGVAASTGEAVQADSLIALATAHHRANFDLWHEEDKARDPDAPDDRIAAVKHVIDALNQRRNDLVEAMDRMLLDEAGNQNRAAPLHSESPALILDRLSILALKLYHTTEESRRTTASDAHRRKNRERLLLINEQRGDLAACLDALWNQVLRGERRFKLYRQMKMYNDPELNPVVYAKTWTKKTG